MIRVNRRGPADDLGVRGGIGTLPIPQAGIPPLVQDEKARNDAGPVPGGARGTSSPSVELVASAAVRASPGDVVAPDSIRTERNRGDSMTSRERASPQGGSPGATMSQRPQALPQTPLSSLHHDQTPSLWEQWYRS